MILYLEHITCYQFFYHFYIKFAYTFPIYTHFNVQQYFTCGVWFFSNILEIVYKYNLIYFNDLPEVYTRWYNEKRGNNLQKIFPIKIGKKQSFIVCYNYLFIYFYWLMYLYIHFITNIWYINIILSICLIFDS